MTPDLYGGALFLAALIYFVPSIIVVFRSTRHTAGIVLLNVFLGWTLLGWVGALIWAVTAPRPLREIGLTGACDNCGMVYLMPPRVDAMTCPGCRVGTVEPAEAGEVVSLLEPATPLDAVDSRLIIEKGGYRPTGSPSKTPPTARKPSNK